jgi:phage/plasmid-like protein (TIGR03299 family)
MSILDSILDNMENGIVSENHDLGSINYGGDAAIRSASGSRPSEPWDQSEYGISLAEAQAKYDAAQTPEAREKVIAELKERAIRRASLDTSNGRVAVFSANGVLPWHGLGVVVKGSATSAEAIRHASLDWQVGKQELYYIDHTGTQRKAKDIYGIVRQDTGEILGSVGSRYKPIQNSEGFDFLDGVLNEFGAKYETAGSLYGGKKVWMLAHLPEQGFTINGGDRQEPYVIFENCHDGTGAAAVYPTAVRVVCANTFRMAHKDKAKGLSIRHTGDVKDKIAAAQAALNIAVNDFAEYKEKAEYLYSKQLPIKAYAHDVLDAVLDITQAQADMGADVLAAAIAKTQAQQDLLAKSFEKKIERRGEILADIIERYEVVQDAMR